MTVLIIGLANAVKVSDGYMMAAGTRTGFSCKIS